MLAPESEKIVGLWADAVVRELDIEFVAATGNKDPEVCARLRYEVMLRFVARWMRREGTDSRAWLEKLALALEEMKRQAEYDTWVWAGCPGLRPK